MKDLRDEGNGREEKKEQVSAWLCNLLAGSLMLEMRGEAIKNTGCERSFLSCLGSG